MPDVECGPSKRVFPYHVWLPFDGKQTPIYQVNCIYSDSNSLDDVVRRRKHLHDLLARFVKVYFVLNFVGGFLLVCCILPIDLMVMSYMRYIRFQFGVLKKDLVNVRPGFCV